MRRRIIKRGAGTKRMNGKDFLLADEIDYILGHCGARVLLYDRELAPLVAAEPR